MTLQSIDIDEGNRANVQTHMTLHYEGIEIVAGTAIHAGIAVGNHWGTGMGMTYGTPAKPIPGPW